MPAVKIDSFSGIMPRVHPTLLPDSCAVKAHNCRLKSGKLSPLRQPLKAVGKKVRLENGPTKIADAQSLFLWRRGASVEEFLAWPGIVKVAQGNIADDAFDRIFVSGSTGIGGTGKNHPCVYIASASGLSFNRHSIYKASLAAPTVTPAQGVPTDADNIRYTVFFQTWVDEYGYESGVSLPSAEIQYSDGDEVTIAAVNAPDGGELRRIYKVVTGSTTDRIQFIAEQEVAGSGFIELTLNIKDEDAGEVLSQLESPPEDLTWMSYVPGNFYAGVSTAKHRTVMFSDVNRPTSWPTAYRYDIRDDIMGIAVSGNTVFALTNGYPWSITGTAPESMSVSSLSSPQSCVSSRSICVMAGSVFYASNDGICMLRPGEDVIVLTEKYFSKREWELLNPSTCIMDTYDGALYCWFTLTTGVRQGYIIALGEGVSAITTHNEQAKAVMYDAQTDSLYYVREV
jgi:hypothetical protein